ncbi:polysaccharide deacetylase family protein [Nocardia higoensis]|uniref:polysaccharide deacetylase family protein n=1 Tax=Nocardia higoensis TaxID=228599 RepID=UPI0002FB273C|nr:polysaccharide deacetylase family protein [Nocardia higoensis]
MRRRELLTLAAGAAWLLSACTAGSEAAETLASDGAAGGPEPLPPAPTRTPLLPPPPGGPKTRLTRQTITALPGAGTAMALTVDDGADPEVVGGYIRFARDTGARFTFFVTAHYDAWTTHRADLRPLVESGQVQLANHTWSHADLTTLPPAGIAAELSRARQFLRDNYGVDGTPYYRPPFGRHNAAVDAVAADLGYTVPTMWYGSLSDSGLITEQFLLECADRWFNPQSIVIGHANAPTVTHCYARLVEIIRARNLSLVTLDDVLLPPV